MNVSFKYEGLKCTNTPLIYIDTQIHLRLVCFCAVASQWSEKEVSVSIKLCPDLVCVCVTN